MQNLMDCPHTPERPTVPVAPNAPLRPPLSARRNFREKCVIPLTPHYIQQSEMEDAFHIAAEQYARDSISHICDGLELCSDRMIGEVLFHRKFFSAYRRVLVISVQKFTQKFTNNPVCITSVEDFCLMMSNGNLLLHDENGIAQLIIEIDDAPWVNIKQFFGLVSDLINISSDNEVDVIIHCQEGISRSPTLVASYLMITKQMTFVQALDFLRHVRPCVEPNIGFIMQLKSLGDRLQSMRLFHAQTMETVPEMEEVMDPEVMDPALEQEKIEAEQCIISSIINILD